MHNNVKGPNEVVNSREKETNKQAVGHEIKEIPQYPWVQDIGELDMKNDTDFRCYIGFFIESSSKYYGLIEMFNEAAENGKRWEMKVISKEYIKKTVLDHCSKTREKKPFNLLCDQIIRYAGYSFEGRIPPSLLGYFIKYEIRRLKNAYEEHLEYKKKYEEAKIERLTGAHKDLPSKTEEEIHETKVKPKSANKPKEVGSAKQLNKGKLTKLTVPYGRRRPESELTIRPEEKRGIGYINDYPLKGPQVYLVITTIYEQLPSELIEIMRMPVVCIVKVGEENLQITSGNLKLMDMNEFTILIDKRTHNGSEENHSPNMDMAHNSNEKVLCQSNGSNNECNKPDYDRILLEINKYYYELRSNSKRFDWEDAHSRKTTEVQRFWLTFNKKVRKPENSGYEETTLSKYLPSLNAIDYGKCDWKEQLKSMLYDEITYSMYNQYQISELYKKYTSSNKLHIWSPNKLNRPMDLLVYNNNLENIPNECINVPIIFDSMIDQVTEYLKESENLDLIMLDDSVIKETQEHDQTLKNKLIELNKLYDLHAVKDKCEKSVNIKPEIILLGDKIKLTSKHIGKRSKFIIKRTMYPLRVIYSALFKQLNFSREFKETLKKHKLIFQKSLKVRQRKKLAEIIILSQIIKNNFKSSENDESHENLSKRVNLEENSSSYSYEYEYLIEKELNHNDKTNFMVLTHLNAIQELESNIMLQTMYDLTLTHNTHEVIYIPLLDSFLYKFYNCPKNKFRTAVMQVPINLRDFIKYSLPHEKLWAQNVLNDLYTANIPSNYQSQLHKLKEIMDPISESIEITPKHFFDNKSLPFEKEDDNEDNKAVIKYLQEISYRDSFLSQTLPTHQKLKKDKRPTTEERSVRYASLRKDTNVSDYSKFFKEKKKNGQIYDLGPGPRLQFNYRSIEALFRHGTKIRIQYKHKLYGRRTLNLELQISNHRLYYSSNIHINSEKAKFLLIHRSGIILSFEECKREQQLLKDFKDRNFKAAGTKQIGDEIENGKINPSPKSTLTLQSLYAMTITWPSSFLLETKFLDDNNIYIKQCYLRGCPIDENVANELYRVYLKNNTILKFLKDNSIEILYATGKKITCSEWERDNSENPDKLIKMKSYMVYHSCGKIYNVNSNGQEINIGSLNIQETLDFSLDCILLEMENGTTILYKNDGTQIVQFTDGTRFTTEIKVYTAEEYNAELGMRITEVRNELNDTQVSCFTAKDFQASECNIAYGDYAYILMSTVVEHPKFATMSYSPITQTTLIKLPRAVAINIYPDKTYSITFSKSSVMLVKKDRIIFDKYKDGSLFQHSVITPNVLKYNIIPEPPLTHFFTNDIYGNELKINTQAEIYYNYALSEENSFCLKDLESDTHFMLVRRDLSGMELFFQQRLMSIKNIVNQIKGSKVQDYWNVPFKDTVLFYPTKNQYEEWNMPYSNNCLNDISKLPSTYGMTWGFPFSTKEESNARTPSILVLALFKTLVINDINDLFEKTIQKYRNLIDKNIKILNCKHKKSRPWNETSSRCIKKTGRLLYKEGSIPIKYPDSEFIRFLKHFLLLHLLRTAKTEKSKLDEVNKFRLKRSSVLKREIPPYFLSPFGMAYFVTKDIQDRISKIIERREYSSALCTLLNKDTKTVTQSDINDIANLLTTLKPGIFKNDISIKNVLIAGKELEDSFKNMLEVVKYHLSLRQTPDCQRRNK